MLKSAISVLAAALLLGSASFALADSDEGNSYSGRLEMTQANQAYCNVLEKQFDAAKTDNAAAKALRKQGGNDCFGTLLETTDDGVKELKQALNMIGITPKAQD